MTQQFTVRRAVLEDDWDALSAMRGRVEARMRDMGHDTDVARGLDRMAHYELREQLYVIRYNGRLVACHALTDDGDAAFWTQAELWAEALYLDNAMVEPSFAHRGLGHMIIAHAREEAQGRGMKLLRLDCQRIPRLRAHWEHLGFTWLRDVIVPGRTSGTLMEMKT